MNEKRRERNRDYFIEITCKLIKEEGMEAATIRNIAKIAGYNSATLYTYFDNQAHLIFCAYMQFEEELLQIMKSMMPKKGKSYLEIWPKIYTRLAQYYFDNPNIFECSYVTVYDTEGGKKRQKEREENSALMEYLSDCFAEVVKETKLPMEQIVRIHGICFSITIGTVLLAVKERIGEPSKETVKQLEVNVKTIIDSMVFSNAIINS